MSWDFNFDESKFYYVEKEIDFTEANLDYDQFLLQEFFNANSNIRIDFSQYYSSLYGNKALSYLNRKYLEWANGDYYLTDLMRQRILYLMPKFLDEKAKYRLGINEFVNSIKNTITSFQLAHKEEYKKETNINPEKIISIYEEEWKKIENITIKEHRFHVLNDKEKDHILEICKYILKTILQKKIKQIERDFDVFLPYITKFNYDSFSARYSIQHFNLITEIRNINSIPKFEIKEIETNTRFDEYANKYLAYELLSIQKDTNNTGINSFLNTNDIQIFLNHYENLLNGDSEATINSIFQGEGGLLKINIKVTPIKLLKKYSIIIKLKIIIPLIVILIFISIAIVHNLIKVVIFLCGFWVYVLLLSIKDEIKELKKINAKLKIYGK